MKSQTTRIKKNKVTEDGTDATPHAHKPLNPNHNHQSNHVTNLIMNPAETRTGWKAT